MFHDIKPRKSFSEFIKQSQTESRIVQQTVLSVTRWACVDTRTGVGSSSTQMRLRSIIATS
jgi:hypothetical protein